MQATLNTKIKALFFFVCFLALCLIGISHTRLFSSGVFPFYSHGRTASPYHLPASSRPDDTGQAPRGVTGSTNNEKQRDTNTWKSSPERGAPKWQNLDTSREAFVYSAHFDDVDFPPLVRIVGLVKAKGASYKEVTCRFYGRHDNTSMHNTSGTLYPFRRPNGRVYIGAFVDCPLPDKLSFLPYSVSVFKTNDSENTNFMIINYSHSPEWLKAHNNTASIVQMLHKTGQPNNTEEIKRKRQEDTWKYNVTRCFPAIWSYNDHLSLLDMVSASLALGVNHFVFYVHSAGPDVLTALKMLESEGVAEVHAWNLQLGPVQVHNKGQFSAVQDCLYRHLWSSRFLLFGDLDELFVPRQHLSLMSLLEPLSLQKPKCGAFIFLHKAFNCHGGTQAPPSSVDPRGVAVKFGLKSLTRVFHEDAFFKKSVRSKPAADPHKVSVGSVHEVKSLRQGFKECVLPLDEGVLHHYRCFPPFSSHKQINDTFLWQLGPAITEKVQFYLDRFNQTKNDPQG